MSRVKMTCTFDSCQWAIKCWFSRGGSHYGSKATLKGGRQQLLSRVLAFNRTGSFLLPQSSIIVVCPHLFLMCARSYETLCIIEELWLCSSLLLVIFGSRMRVRLHNCVIKLEGALNIFTNWLPLGWDGKTWLGLYGALPSASHITLDFAVFFRLDKTL